MSIVSNNELRTVSGGETAEGLTVYGGLVAVSGGVVTDTTVAYGGEMYVQSAAAAGEIAVSGGTFAVYNNGAASAVNIYRDGAASVNSGGVMVDTVVNSGGQMTVTFNGVASNVSLSSGGELVVKGGKEIYLGSNSVSTPSQAAVTATGVTGGVLTGTITIAAGAQITAEAGAMLDLVITVEQQVTEENSGKYIINNLSAVKGDATCCITVSADMNDGKYLITENAAGFTGTYKIGTNGIYSDYTTVTVGTVLSNKYVLRQENSILYLYVGYVSTVTAPEITINSNAKVDADGNIVTDSNGNTVYEWAQEVKITAEFDRTAAAREYKIGNGMWKTYTGSVTVKSNTTVYFKATDSAGFTNVSSIDITNIDRAKPTLSVSGPKKGSHQSYDVAIEVADNSSETFTIYYKAGNGDWTRLDGNTYTVEANGSFYFKAIDEAGNVSDEFEWVANNIDREGAAAPVIYYNGETSYDGSPVQSITLAADFADDTVRNEYSLDGGLTWQEYTGEILVASEEITSVVFRSFDEAGNSSEVAVAALNIDRTAPVAPVLTWNDAPAQSVELIAAAEEGALIEYKVAGTDEWLVYNGAMTYIENITLVFRATDLAGNVSEESTCEITNIDRIAPDAPVAAADVTESTNGKVIVSATFAADSVKNEYSLNGAEWAEYNGEIEFADNGTVSFRSTDAAGNVSGVTSYTVSNIDKLAPDAPVVGADITNMTNLPVTVSIIQAEEAARNEYSLDGGITWVEYTDGVVFEDNGSVSFRTIDAAGNVSGVTSYTVSNIDKLAPEAPVAIADWSNDVMTNKPVTVMATFDELSHKNEYSIDGGNTWEVYTRATTFTDNGTIIFRSAFIREGYTNYAYVTYEVTCIDIVPPENPVAVADVTEATNGNVTVSATFDAASAKNEYKVDGGEWQTVGAGEVSYTFTENGVITFRSSDELGNTCETVYTVGNIDKVAPVLPVVTADITEATNTNVVVSAVFAIDSVKNEYSLDGTTWQEYTAAIEFTENGTVFFRSTDAVGNVSDVLEYSVANIDKVAPVAPVAAADVTELTNGNVVVSATFADDAAKNEYSLDGAEWVEYTGAIEFAANGTVSFRTIDAAGNVSEVVEYVVGNIDKVAPVAPAAVADITEATNGNVLVSATFAADSVKNEYSLDGAEWIEYTAAIEFAANGTVSFRSTDAAGNVSEVVEYVVSNIDKIVPKAPVTFADVTELTNGNVIVSATFAADSVKNEYALNGAEWVEYTAAIEFAANGTVSFRSTDAAGNVSEVVEYTVSNIDKVAPESPVAVADVTAATNGNVVVSATFAADSVKNEYSLDGKTWQTYTAAIEFAANGTVSFRSTDAAGNVSVTEYAVGNIDKVAPAAPVAAADVTAATNGNVLVSATFAEDSAKNEYSLDGKNWQTYTAAIEFTANGTVSFRSTDVAGNVSEVVEYTVGNIDKVAPAAPVAAADVTAATNGNVVVSATFADDSVKNEYSLDGKTWQTYTAAIEFAANGTVAFRSIDAAGNVSETEYVVSNIDKEAPAAPVATADITAWTNGSVAVSAEFAADAVKKEYSLNGSDWFTYTSNVVMNNNGTVLFRAADALGNVSAETAFEVSNIDKTAPVITITGVPTEITTDAVTVTAVAVDDASGIKSIEYSLDNKTWQAGSSVTVSKNGAVYFRATDNGGNVYSANTFVEQIVEKYPNSNLLSNGTSQIVGYDAEQGKVGYVAVDGNVSPVWKGVWEWAGSEIAMWQVAGVGNFNAENVNHDGILLKNLSNNTFAAWTDLGRGDYGYVSLGYVDGNFDAVSVANLGGNGNDDVIIRNESGSFGVMIDAVEYRDIWNVSSPELDIWQIEGAGSFGGNADKLVVTNKQDGFVYLWENMDTTFSTWNWQQTALGSVGTTWEVAAIGDFEGDGIDDIMVVDKNSNNVWVWDDGNYSDRRWRGTLGEGFKIEAVGDYNADGKEDLLLREYNTGWGGMGYWGAGYAGNWVDLNARIETDLESKFSVIA